jgi:hypothetical protein
MARPRRYPGVPAETTALQVYTVLLARIFQAAADQLSEHELEALHEVAVVILAQAIRNRLDEAA